MDRYLRAYFDKDLQPNRAQHLIVSDSKHLFYYDKDEVVRYQKKELDARTCGNRKLVTRIVAIDEDTGVLYGELRPRDEKQDLVGFLARAWARKSRHPMRGFPKKLHVPSRVMSDESMAKDVAWCADLGGVTVCPSPGGFGPATVASREYERQLMSAGAGNGSFVLMAALSAAQEISYLACSNAAAAFGKHWEEVAGPPKNALDAFDGMYENKGGWRLEEFERFIVADGT